MTDDEAWPPSETESIPGAESPELPAGLAGSCPVTKPGSEDAPARLWTLEGSACPRTEGFAPQREGQTACYSHGQNPRAFLPVGPL